MELIFIVLSIIILIVLISIGIYNSLARKKVYVSEAFSGIDVQLKRKANVLPNLIDTIKMQTTYEGELLSKITAMRGQMTGGSNGEKLAANDAFNKALPSIMAVAEAYPALGANISFTKMMDEIADCEDKITYARNRYNVAVTAYNTAVIIFPSSIFAQMFGFKKEEFFEIAAEKRQEIDDMRISDIK